MNDAMAYIMLTAGFLNVGVAVVGLIFFGVAAYQVLNFNHLAFNAIWGARLALVVTGIFWAVSFFFPCGTAHVQSATAANGEPGRRRARKPSSPPRTVHTQSGLVQPEREF